MISNNDMKSLDVKTPHTSVTSLYAIALKEDLKNDISDAIDAADSKRLAAIMEKDPDAIPYVRDILIEQIKAFNTQIFSSTIFKKPAAEYSPQKVGAILDALPHSELVNLDFGSVFTGSWLYENANREIATLIGAACLSPYVLFEDSSNDFLNTHGDFASFSASFLKQLGSRDEASLANLLAAMTLASVSCLHQVSMKDEKGNPVSREKPSVPSCAWNMFQRRR
jgi:hypothetical protein